MRLEQIVEPGRPGAFFEGHRQSAAQSCKELQNGCGFGFQDGFHDYLALSIHHRYGDGCLMNVQPNILFTVHKGAPFVGGVACAHNLLQKGRPFIMRFRQPCDNEPDMTMKRGVLIVVLLAALGLSGQDYFPAGALSGYDQSDKGRARWYSAQLKALDEPSLLETSKDP